MARIGVYITGDDEARCKRWETALAATKFFAISTRFDVGGDLPAVILARIHAAEVVWVLMPQEGSLSELGAAVEYHDTRPAPVLLVTGGGGGDPLAKRALVRGPDRNGFEYLVNIAQRAVYEPTVPRK